MGNQFLDQYSLLHLAVGIVIYFWGVPLWLWNVIHILFEWTENTETGMYLVNHYIPFWPGGKNYADSWINCLGDILAGHVGWMLAYWLDCHGTQNGWFQRHLNWGNAPL